MAEPLTTLREALDTYYKAHNSRPTHTRLCVCDGCLLYRRLLAEDSVGGETAYTDDGHANGYAAGFEDGRGEAAGAIRETMHVTDKLISHDGRDHKPNSECRLCAIVKEQPMTSDGVS